MEKLDVIKLNYKGSYINAYKIEEIDLNKSSKKNVIKTYICHLYLKKNETKFTFLNLGEMSDGSKFTSVAQSVNEAKWIIDHFLEKYLDEKIGQAHINLLDKSLNELGIKHSYLSDHSTKISERVEIKQKLVNLIDK